MSRRPTPDELGDMLEKGEITKEEAIEIMGQRARDEAFKNLYSPPAPTEPQNERAPRKPGRSWNPLRWLRGR